MIAGRSVWVPQAASSLLRTVIGCSLGNLMQQHSWVGLSVWPTRSFSRYSFFKFSLMQPSRLLDFHAGQVSLAAVHFILIGLYRDTCSGCSAQYHTNERSVQRLCRSDGMSQDPHLPKAVSIGPQERSQAGK